MNYRLPESIEVRTDTSNDDFEVSNSSTRCSVGFYFLFQHVKDRLLFIRLSFID